MRYSLLAPLVVGLVSVVQAHTTVWSLWVNDVDQQDGRSKYIRSPASNDPVKDLTSTDLDCNTKGATEVPTWLTVKAGDKITFEWYHDNRGDDIIASSHKVTRYQCQVIHSVAI
jgi:lytic cellulose monooxygenase (C1-hydroxylating)